MVESADPNAPIRSETGHKQEVHQEFQNKSFQQETQGNSAPTGPRGHRTARGERTRSLASPRWLAAGGSIKGIKGIKGGRGHAHLDVMTLHVVRGVPEEAVHDEALRVDAVDQGERRLQERTNGPSGSGTASTVWVGAAQTEQVMLGAGERAELHLQHQSHPGGALIQARLG